LDSVNTSGERQSVFSWLKEQLDRGSDETQQECCGETESDCIGDGDTNCGRRRSRGDRPLMQALRRLLMGIRDIQCKINSPRFGLAEIKHEVRCIEAALGQGQCVLGDIKRTLREIEGILENPQFGLAEIKDEIRDIQCQLNNPSYGLAEIKQEIRDLEREINNPCYGLAEIRQEVHDIEAILGNEDFGLCEIKREIHDIESALCGIENTLSCIEEILGNEDFGLPEIKHEIREIECEINNPCYGLPEIMNEIHDIECKLDRLIPGVSGSLSTGPVVTDNSAGSLVVAVLNVTNSTQTVAIKVFDIGTCPDRRTMCATTTLTLQCKCARTFIFDRPPLLYEVEFVGTAGTFTAWTATRTQGQSAPLSSSTFLGANTFRHSELTVQTD
jgi:hypothetical protein